MHHLITPGAVVQTADQIELRVRALEGNVAELEAFDGSFVGFRHVSSLTVCLPPATETAPAQSLAAAAGTGQGAGTYEIACPPGMLAHGHHIKRFTSLQAFEGYVAHLHSAGRTVTWHAPFAARVWARA